MPNLVVTNACNLRCPFCFASEYKAEGPGCSADHVTPEAFRAQLEFVGSQRVRFCGGEPTLHPQFPELLRLALDESGRRVLLMTNGLWSDAVREHVAQLPRRDRGRLSYLVNVLEDALYTPAQRERLHATLASVDRHAVTLGLTLYTAPYDFTSILAAAKRHRIDNIRFSVAAPNVTDPRSWNVDPERDFPALAADVVRLSREARAARRHLQSDCGYIPPCFFTDAERAEIARHHPGAVRERCHGPVDIGPDGTAWRCYGLYAVLRADTADYRSGEELAGDFERRAQDLDRHLLKDDCAACAFRERGECGGGCFAFRVTRSLRRQGVAAGVPLEDGPALWSAVPRLREQDVHQRPRTGRALLMLRVDGEWSPFHATAEEQRVLAACDGRRDLAALAGALGTDVKVVARAVRRFLEQGAITLAPGNQA